MNEYEFWEIHDRPDILNPLKKFWLFVYAIASQQAISILFIIFYQAKVGWLGLILTLIWEILLVKLLISFKTTHLRWNDLKKRIKQIWQPLIGIFLLSAVWTGILAKTIGTSNQVSKNQLNIESFFKAPSSITYVFIAAVIIGPIIEEFSFRYLMINGNSKKMLIVQSILSTLLFAIFHLAQQLTTLIQNPSIERLTILIANSGQYLIIGGILSYMYAKHRNFTYNVTIHAAWNLLAMTLSLLSTLK